MGLAGNEGGLEELVQFDEQVSDTTKRFTSPLSAAVSSGCFVAILPHLVKRLLSPLRTLDSYRYAPVESRGVCRWLFSSDRKPTNSELKQPGPPQQWRLRCALQS